MASSVSSCDPINLLVFDSVSKTGIQTLPNEAHNEKHTPNKIGFIQSHRHRSADDLVVDRRMHRAVHTGERRKFGNRLLDARDERLDGMRERTRLLAAHLPPPERTKPGPNQPVHAVRGQEALAQRLEQCAIRPVVLDQDALNGFHRRHPALGPHQRRYGAKRRAGLKHL